MSVLAKSEIERRLDSSEIFVTGSWDRGHIRSAAYDLRVAPDYLVAPSGIRYWPGAEEGKQEWKHPIILEPGQVAFVSSVERLCMPIDLIGNIAQKFRLARNGLLVMGGLLVDPGYGCELNESGKWIPKENGERLHFLLANIGGEQRTILPGRDSIAGIQFLTLNGSGLGEGEEEKDLYVPSSKELLESVFDRGEDRPLAQLAFFVRTKELESRVTEDLESEVEELRKDAAKQRVMLESTKRSTELVVVFGVFLVSITLFTVAIAALINALSGGSIRDMIGIGGKVELTWAGFVIAVVVLAIIGWTCWAMMQPVISIAKRLSRAEDAAEKEAG